jgi:hypothetical protein
VVRDELRRLRLPRGQPAPTLGEAPGGATHGTRDVSAVAVARGLLSGEFRPPEPEGARTAAPGEPAAEADLRLTDGGAGGDRVPTRRRPKG